MFTELPQGSDPALSPEGRQSEICGEGGEAAQWSYQAPLGTAPPIYALLTSITLSFGTPSLEQLKYSSDLVFRNPPREEKCDSESKMARVKSPSGD